ncbi:MAG: N-acetyltransferase family protein [Granulosicoccus sp.]
MNCRTATEQDIPEACRLLNAIITIGGTTAYEVPLDNSEFSSHFITGDGCITCIVCEDTSGRILGFQALNIHPELPPNWVDIATFSQSSQKIKGVGTKLFGATCEFLKATDVQVINATIRADNRPGLAYYSRMGFVDYYTHKAIPLIDGTPVDRISRRYDV